MKKLTGCVLVLMVLGVVLVPGSANAGIGIYGTWWSADDFDNATRVILLIVIVAIITFIIIGNPGFLKDLETFYGALAGVGALIPIMSSLLGKGGRSQ